MYVDETRKNCMAARTDGSLSVPPTCGPRQPGMHDTAISHCDFTTPHNGHSARHWYEEGALHKKIDWLGFQGHGLHCCLLVGGGADLCSHWPRKIGRLFAICRPPRDYRAANA